MRKLALALLAVHAAALPAGTLEAQESVPRPATVRESFPVDRSGDLLILPGEIDGKFYEFLFDTGASNTLLDLSLRSHLGRKLDRGDFDTMGGTGDSELEVYRTPDIRFRSLRFPADDLAGCHDLEKIRQVFGRNLRGIVGVSFFRDYIVRIDFDEGRLNVMPPDTVAGSDWGEQIPFRYDSDGFVSVLATVGEDVREWFVIDTGCSFTGNLREPVFAQLHRANQLKVNGQGKFATFDRRESRPEGRVSAFTLGTYRHKYLIFSRSQRNVLGLGFLRRYHVTIDFPGRKLYLAKGKAFETIDSVDQRGLHILLREGRVVVESVDVGSPAERAGIRANDRLVGVEGEPAGELGLFQIRRLLAFGGNRPVHVTVDRAGKTTEREILATAAKEHPE